MVWGNAEFCLGLVASEEWFLLFIIRETWEFPPVQGNEAVEKWKTKRVAGSYVLRALRRQRANGHRSQAQRLALARIRKLRKGIDGTL